MITNPKFLVIGLLGAGVLVVDALVVDEFVELSRGPNLNIIGFKPSPKLSRRHDCGIPGLEVVVTSFLAATHFSNSNKVKSHL